MDILYWTNLNQSVEIKDTKSLFYKKYLYKMEVYCPGGRSANEENIGEALNVRTGNQARQANYGGYWGRSARFDLANANMAQLSVLRSLILDQTGYQVRVEEPNVSFYASNEGTLKSIIGRFDYDMQSRIRYVCGPRNDQHRQLLLDNKKIFSKKGNKNREFKYLVKMKDRRIDNQTKHQLARYLDSLGDLVHIPPSSRDMLNNDYGFWGVYFYSNDRSILSFVELIVPGSVSNVQEIVLVDDK